MLATPGGPVRITEVSVLSRPPTTPWRKSYHTVSELWQTEQEGSGTQGINIFYQF